MTAVVVSADVTVVAVVVAVAEKNHTLIKSLVKLYIMKLNYDNRFENILHDRLFLFLLTKIMLNINEYRIFIFF